jgi:zinc D-Ala-D-Ala carboxypeptidase
LLAAVMMKASVILRFLGGLALGVSLLLLLVFRVTSCAPSRTLPGPVEDGVARLPATSPGAPSAGVGSDCRADGWAEAARINGETFKTLTWAPFGRAETGWEIYLPLIQDEIGAACAPDTQGFAAAFANWEREHGLRADGVLSEADFQDLKNRVQFRREFVRFTADRGCPDASDVIAAARPEEGYAGKQIHLRPGALRAYRQMAAAARAEVPEIAADPRNLTIFSGYRSPAADAERCRVEGNCNGIVRARCSAHRTGLALDLYVGQAPGYGPDSTADPNRLHMSRTATYLWLVRNARRFGFTNYPFEPWHWEWTGEAP